MKLEPGSLRDCGLRNLVWNLINNHLEKTDYGNGKFMHPPNAQIAPNMFDFCPPLRAIAEGGLLRGRSGKTVVPTGVSTLNNLVFLRNILLALKPARTLEVGLAYGGSALLFAASHRDLGRSPGGQHIAIDPFQSSSWDDCGLITLEENGFREFIEFHGALSSETLPELVKRGTKIDLAYVDGSHLFEDVFIDFYFLTRLLNMNGVIIFDDSSDPHVKKVIKFIRTNRASTYSEIDSALYRHDHGTNFRFRFARLVGRSQLTAFRKVGPSERIWNEKFAEF